MLGLPIIDVPGAKHAMDRETAEWLFRALSVAERLFGDDATLTLQDAAQRLRAVLG